MNNTTNNYDKEKYIQKKKEQLKNAYQMIDDACEEIRKGNNDFFIKYLDTQSRFDKYTFRNALLVSMQMPEARQLKDYNSWKELKVDFKNNSPKRIIILEPGKSYLNSDGDKVTPYNAKEMIDVSETNTKAPIKDYDKKMILHSLLCDSPIKIKVSDTLEDTICKWSEEDNVIYVKNNNETYDPVISSIVKEMAKYLIYTNSEEISDDKAKCVSYMICKKYNIDYSFDDVPRPLVNLELSNIKEELSSIKNTFEDINNQMTAYLEKLNKEKNKEKER